MRTFKTFDYIFITGVTGTGKSTLLQEILDTYSDVELLQKYTTRDMREDEKTIPKKRLEYNFITEENTTFLDNILELSLVNTYHTANGDHLYAFPKYNNPKEDVTYIQVLGADDIIAIMDKGEFPENALLINITTDKKSVLQKLSKRMDDEESERRYQSDCNNFGITGVDGECVNFWNRISRNFTPDRNSNYIEVSNVMYFMTPKEILKSIMQMFVIDHKNKNYLKVIKHLGTGLPILQTNALESHTGVIRYKRS